MMLRATLITVAIAIAATAAHAEVYRWVDENGNVHYGDTIPPEYAKGQSERLNKQGVVVESKGAEMTPEAMEQRAAEKVREAEERRQSEKQEAYDRFLLTTYETRNDLIAAHTNKLNLLDARIQIGEGSVADSEAALTSLKARAEKETAKNGKLNKQIRQFEIALSKGRTALDAMKRERARIVAEHERDLARFDELKGAAGAPAPRP